jgi:hypothetical protein
VSPAGHETGADRPDVGREAVALIEARLGRPPQDMLEAAVVLEAWAGVPAQRALETGVALMPGTPAAPLASAAALKAPARRRGQAVEGLAFVVSVLAIALWAAPLARAVGAAAVTHGLTVALPLTLALQWWLRSRYLNRPRGLAALARRRHEVAFAAVAVVAAPEVALGRAGAVAGLLTLIWVGGTLLIRRGWPALYALIVLAATPAISAAPLPVLAATAAVTGVAVAAALRLPDAPDWTAGGWERAAVSALIGAGLGVMLVADPSVTWSGSGTPALALLPSAVAGVWAGQRLSRLGHTIPHSLTGVPAVASAEAGAGASPGRRFASLGALLGAIWRLALGAAAGSLALLVATPVPAGLLVAFALLALATLLLSLLEAIGRTVWAALGLACALAVEIVAPAPFAGASLAVGAAAGALLLLPVSVAPLLRPARTLATTLWIA